MDKCNRCGEEINDNDTIVIEGHLYCSEYGGCSDWSDDPNFEPENGKDNMNREEVMNNLKQDMGSALNPSAIEDMLTNINAGIAAGLRKAKEPEPNETLELDLFIDYDIDPGQREIVEENPQPGFPPEATPTSIQFRGIELIDKFTEKELENLGEEKLERMEDE